MTTATTAAITFRVVRRVGTDAGKGAGSGAIAGVDGPVSAVDPGSGLLVVAWPAVCGSVPSGGAPSS
jgi:hypothetical protein